MGAQKFFVPPKHWAAPKEVSSDPELALTSLQAAAAWIVLFPGSLKRVISAEETSVVMTLASSLTQSRKPVKIGVKVGEGGCAGKSRN